LVVEAVQIHKGVLCVNTMFEQHGEVTEPSQTVQAVIHSF